MILAERILMVALLLGLPVLLMIIASMRAGMFWCPKCRTYHYKQVAPPRCYRDWAEHESKRQRRVKHALHRR